MISDFHIPKAIYLYYKEEIKDIDFKKIKYFIKDNFANIKIHLIRLKKETVETNGLLFDFIGTQNNFQTLKYAKEKDSCHIILTNKLFATFDEPSPCAQGLGEDKRPHIRASVYSFPSVISTSGIVEGPAKPREFYIYKQKYSQLGTWEIEGAKIKQKFKGRFVDYKDKRLTEVLNGYIAQAIFFYITGEPFCRQKRCRLFNAHWQDDLIFSQIKWGRFCAIHKKILRHIASESSKIFINENFA